MFGEQKKQLKNFEGCFNRGQCIGCEFPLPFSVLISDEFCIVITNFNEADEPDEG